MPGPGYLIERSEHLVTDHQTAQGLEAPLLHGPRHTHALSPRHPARRRPDAIDMRQQVPGNLRLPLAGRQPGGDVIEDRLFALILERDGRFKFVSYANRL